MANLCAQVIDSCIKASCKQPIFEGVENEALILNKEEIAQITPSGSKITGIVMKQHNTGTEADPVLVDYCAYTVTQLGNKPFEGTQTEMVTGTYGNKFNNTVVIAVPDNGPEVSEHIIDKLANGSFVVVTRNSYVHVTDAEEGFTGGDNKYQVYGSQKGLKATSIVREAWGDNSGMWIVTLVEENASKSGLFLFVTDEATTDQYYEDMKTGCTCNF